MTTIKDDSGITVYMKEDYTPPPHDTYSDQEREFMDFISKRKPEAPQNGLTRDEVKSRFHRFRSSPYLNGLRVTLRMTPVEHTGPGKARKAVAHRGQADHVPDDHVGLDHALPFKPELVHRLVGDYYNYQGQNSNG